VALLIFGYVKGRFIGAHPLRSALQTALIGGLTGAAVMLLFAPQSGIQTLAQIYQRSIQLRDLTQMDRVSAALEAGTTAVKAA
jgi:gas vesicle protein